MGVVLTMASARAIVLGEGEWPEDAKGFASESTVRGAIDASFPFPLINR